jgi:hypothetical protein
LVRYVVPMRGRQAGGPIGGCSPEKRAWSVISCIQERYGGGGGNGQQPNRYKCHRSGLERNNGWNPRAG